MRRNTEYLCQKADSPTKKYENREKVPDKNLRARIWICANTLIKTIKIDNIHYLSVLAIGCRLKSCHVLLDITNRNMTHR